ncbi:hypothetical protein [Methylocystis parvus]|uniref:Uncharacterized protein n=1 Tax=Methylocystis parvus TaxID=134 RepID=A0A6B8M190_9HYPH|nr:hypothetical protein [Methylocystis parvus]QGM98627.1 hypothetical protein F7D14_14835 [Methylocystis parvus]WBK01027.1 hypothetical protein MMG94_04730 [Methylocystis parvus OBBP]
MADEKPNSFGKRGPPPVVVHKPKPPGEIISGQKRSLAVSLALMGAVTLGAYETFDWIDRKLNCEPDPAKPDELICKHSGSHGGSSSSYRRSGSAWHWGGGSGSTHGVSFGGFGHSGGFFGGG